ncbi:MAG TPA: hypothetical protein VG929_06925 [Actinomycetota bacterium]|nr:hypothetical protein [Actinomycetota bacterium]
MTRSRLVALALAAALVAAFVLPATTASAGKKKGGGSVAVGTDEKGDFNAFDDPTLAPLGDVFGADLIEATIGMADAKTINFVIKVNSLQTVPEVVRYIWGMSVDGNYVELDGKYTNYSRGTCDPTSGQCPPPRDPGMQPFLVRADCEIIDAGASPTTVCKEKGIVKATFDTSANTITIPVPTDMINVKPGSKIAAGSSSFSSQAGGNVLAILNAFFSQSNWPRDTMNTLKTFVVPKK